MSSPHSNPHAADEAFSAVDPGMGLMSSVAELLAPLFKSSSIDRHLAEQMATSAIEVRKTVRISLTSPAPSPSPWQRSPCWEKPHRTT
jgi:hypothetical protein